MPGAARTCCSRCVFMSAAPAGDRWPSASWGPQASTSWTCGVRGCLRQLPSEVGGGHAAPVSPCVLRDGAMGHMPEETCCSRPDAPTPTGHWETGSPPQPQGALGPLGPLGRQHRAVRWVTSQCSLWTVSRTGTPKSGSGLLLAMICMNSAAHLPWYLAARAQCLAHSGVS